MFFGKKKKVIEKPLGLYDAVVHIGAPKTGSSALQYFFLKNREALANKGLYYPEHNTDPNRVSGGHSSFGQALGEDNGTAERMFQQYLQEAKERGLTLLLSAESLFTQAAQCKSVMGDARVKVVAFFRDPIDTIYSNYNQAVKRHFFTRDIRFMCRGLLNSDNERISGQILEEWVEAFGEDKVEIFPYKKRLFDRQSIERYFLTRLGVEGLRGFRFDGQRINRGYSRSALELKRLLNHVLDHGANGINTRIDRCLQYYSDKLDEPAVPLQSVIGCDLYEQLIERFTPDRLAVVTRLMGNADQSLFVYEACEEPAPLQLMRDKVPLETVLIEAFEQNVDLLSYLRDRVELALTEAGSHPSHSLLRLAELFDLPVDWAAECDGGLKPLSLKVFTSEQSAAPDLLREIALAYERMGRMNEAYAVIERALVLRPQGPGIIKIHERIGQVLAKKR